MAIMSSKLLSLLTVLPAAVLAGNNNVIPSNGIVRYDITSGEGGTSLSRRQLAAGTDRKLDGSLYTTQIKFGTPGQYVPIKIDTGSTELWANPTCGASEDRTFCNTQSRFTYSTTLTDLGTTGTTPTRGPRGTTGSANFVYVADYIGVGDARITQQIFGANYASTSAVVGTLGLAPSLSGWTNGYPLFLDNLKSQGFIKSRAFSLDLRGVESSTGAIIFGGIDTKKYQGDLIKLPIIPAGQSPDGFTRYWVYVNEISVNKEDGTVASAYETPEGGKGQAVFIDSGATLSGLPTAIFNKVLAAFPSAQYDSSAKWYTVDCEAPEGVSVDFTFNGKTITVPYEDFIWKSSADTCVLGVVEDSLPRLGANFLRAAYVVFDQDNRNIHIAQADNCGSDLVAIGTGSDSVPSITGGCAVPVKTTSTTEPASTTTSEATSTAEQTSTTETSAETDTATATATDSVTSTTESASETTTTEPATETATTESSIETETATGTESATGTATTETETPTATETISAATSSSAAETDVIPTATPTSELTGVTSFPITGTADPTSIPDRTITYTSIYTSTITSCAPTVTNCPNRPRVTVVTEVITVTTSVCPETSGTYTYTMPGTSGSSSVITLTVVPHPVVPHPTATPVTAIFTHSGIPKPVINTHGGAAPSSHGVVVPGCPGCHAPGAPTTTLIPSYGLPTHAPTGGVGGGNETVARPTSTPNVVVVGGAGRVSGLGWASSALFAVGVAAFAIGL